MPSTTTKENKYGNRINIRGLALLGGAIIGYAKYDPDFRCHLVEYAPFTDDVIKFVFQEEKSYYYAITDLYHSWREALFPGDEESSDQKKKKKRKVVTQPEEEYKPPSLVLPVAAKDAKVPSAQYQEVRLQSKGTGGGEPKEDVVDPREDVVLPETHPQNLADLEKSTTEAAKKAIELYTKAINALRNYIAEVEVIIDDSSQNADQRVWDMLKQKVDAKDEAMKKAETEAKRAERDHRKLKALLESTEFNVKESIKNQAIRNIAELTEDVETAKRGLSDEIARSNITEKYWKRVQEARRYFSDELAILFPSINLKEKKLSIPEGDLDLFVLHAMSKVLYYQKELHKLETVGTDRLHRAVEAAKKGGLEVLTTEQICNELEKEKRSLELEFQKKCLKLRESNERDLRRQLQMQSEAFTDHLNDALKLKEQELEKKLTRDFDEKILEERCTHKEQLAAMVGRLRGLDQAIKVRNNIDKDAHQAQVLWAACQALYRAVKIGCPGFPWSEQLRPLDPEIKAVKLAAGIPPAAKNRGVYPEDALRERFLKVEEMARGLALVPEQGGRLHIYLLSYLQSFLLLRAANPIPQAELSDNETDFSKLTTNDILQRARYWIDRGDFSQTLKYMNLLQGAPRAVARQWMEEARIMLETQQAATTLMAHATASGLVHL
ncbi:mitofilin [Holotrichia oblita]|uniref:Mitofilin n=1 Tax=Holotrichia oblita TaxID=644536 RepID=A0ACB9T5K1_HOLOL|nr:mitofilin [Holotrichia oblita]